MIPKLMILIGLLLCIGDMIPKLDAFRHSYSPVSKSPQFISRNTKHLATMSAFPLEDAVLIEHSNLGIKKAMRWDESSKSFQQYALNESVKQTPLLNFFKNCFVPSGAISSDYYTYSLWRSAQRFVSATSSVFGTQALLLALGFKSNRIGIAAATTWVLKDALGKVSRIFWASKHGRKFDSDAKKWRFRSSILFATGNGLEIFTYIVPSMFLLTAALANALKQMAMLTSSATRNTIYKSFARSSDNIGDITAKGVMISRAIGASRSKISGIFLGLSIFDLICIFKEIKSVIFTSLNFERTNIVLNHLFTEAAGNSFSTIVNKNEEEQKVIQKIQKITAIEVLETLEDGQMDITDESQLEKNADNLGSVVDIAKIKVPRREYVRPIMQSLTPVEVAVREPILLPTRFGEEIFRSWSSVECSPEVLKGAMDLFAGRFNGSVSEVKSEGGEVPDRFIVTLNARVPRSWVDAKRTEIGWQSSAVLRSVQGIPVIFAPQILLHVNATQFDVFRASFIVRKILHEFKTLSEEINVTAVGAKISKLDAENREPESILTSVGLGTVGLIDMIKNAKVFEKKNMRDCVNLLRTAGWDVSKFTFGTLRTRVEW